MVFSKDQTNIQSIFKTKILEINCFNTIILEQSFFQELTTMGNISRKHAQIIKIVH